MNPLSVDLSESIDRDRLSLANLLQRGLYAEVQRFENLPIGGVCSSLLDAIKSAFEPQEFAERLGPTSHYVVRRFLGSAVNGENDLEARLFWVIMALFDNFAPSVECSCNVPIPRCVSGFACFHELDVAVCLNASQIRLSSTAHIAMIESDGGILHAKIRRHFEPPLAATFSKYADPVLFGAVPFQEIDENADLFSCYTTLMGALASIRIVTPAIYQRIAQHKLWLVPLRSTAADVHRSFSSPELPGVVFTSLNGASWQIAEAIVHEFSHTELDSYSCLGPLVNDSTTLFYSPWRPDPRPLNGLLHALFVFCEVWFFLDRVRLRASRYELNDIVARQTLYLHRLNLGLSQVPPDGLTQKGEVLHRCLARRIAEIASLSDSSASPEPREISEHLKYFRKTNPGVQVKAGH